MVQTHLSLCTSSIEHTGNNYLILIGCGFIREAGAFEIRLLNLVFVVLCGFALITAIGEPAPDNTSACRNWIANAR